MKHGQGLEWVQAGGRQAGPNLLVQQPQVPPASGPFGPPLPMAGGPSRLKSPEVITSRGSVPARALIKRKGNNHHQCRPQRQAKLLVDFSR